MADILRKYWSDFGILYVQIALGDLRIELWFDHEPDEKEVDEKILELSKSIDISVSEQNNMSLTIEKAILFLEEEYNKLTSANVLDENQTKLVAFMESATKIVSPIGKVVK